MPDVASWLAKLVRPPATDSVHYGTAKGRWVLAACIAGSSVAMLDATVVNVALTQIGKELDVGFAGLQWISNAYTLTLASFILLGGVLGDRFGRRRMFLIGMGWFAAASALCAVSGSGELLILFRALQGIGGALLTPGSLSIISATFAPDDRARAIGAWSGLGGIATAAGPFLGGWLVEVSWRLVFLVNLPLAVAVILIALRHVPETRQSSAAGTSIDAIGSMILVLALGTLTYGLTTAGASGWDGPTILAGVCGVVAAGAFVLWEDRTSHPLVPLTIFASRVFTAANIVTVFIYAALGVFFFLLVIQLQAVAGWSPLAAGTAVLPSTALMLLLSARAGALSQRVGPRLPMTVGSLLAALGFLLATRIGPDASYVADVLPAVLALGLGLSFAVAPLTAAVLGAVPDDLAGAASGINNAVARTAGLLAVVIIPAVAGLSSAGLSDATVLNYGFRLAMVIGAALLVAAALVSWFGVGPVHHAPDATSEPDARPPYQCPVSAPQLQLSDPGRSTP